MTDEIDAVVHEETVKRDVYPTPLNYNDIPKNCCTSINNAVGHGITSVVVLDEGVIVNIDVTLYYDGTHGEWSETFLVDEADEKCRKLANVTYECLELEMAEFCPDFPVNKIEGEIKYHAVKQGFSAARNFCGHEVNSVFHITPNDNMRTMI